MQVPVNDILRKPYGRMVIPDSDGSFFAEIVEFSGCFAVGATAAEALELLEEVAADWIAASVEQGQDIPEPLGAAGYSGKLVLRMSKSLHQKAALFADRDGVSLNQFIVTCLAEHVGARAKPLALIAHSTHTVFAPFLELPALPMMNPSQPEFRHFAHSIASNTKFLQTPFSRVAANA